MSVTSKTSNLEMSMNNNYLDVVMTSTISLNGNTPAIKAGVAGNMMNKICPIYAFV